MSGGEDVDRDLLGDPIRPIRDPRGRPSYAKTKENQRLVITLRAAGHSQEDIATFVGCDPKTLRKNFSRELDYAAVLLDGMALQVLVGEMLKGNVAAAKAVRGITALRPPSQGKPKDNADRPAAVGKKARAVQDAKTPTMGWGELVERKLN